MLIEVISFIPFITCLFWLVLNLLLNKNGKEFRTLGYLLSLLGIISFAQTVILYGENDWVLPCFFARQFFMLLLIPALLLYVSKLTPGMVFKPANLAWIAVPVSLLFAESIILMLSGTDIVMRGINNSPLELGTDKAAKIIHICSFTVFYSILALQVIIWTVITVRKLSQKSLNRHFHFCSALILIIAAMETANLTAGLKESWLYAALSVMLSAAIFSISYAQLFPTDTKAVVPDEIKKEAETIQKPHEPDNLIIESHQNQIEEENLRIRFEDLIVTEQLFLKQGIRISDIASMLETNRTYVSRLVNNTYNMSFSDYINTLRIDYAEQYLIHHREAKQSDIAAACGFPNASAFNNVFKKITGVTPKIWLATRSGQSK